MNSFRLTTVKNNAYLCTYIPVFSFTCLQQDEAEITKKHQVLGYN